MSALPRADSDTGAGTLGSVGWWVLEGVGSELGTHDGLSSRSAAHAFTRQWSPVCRLSTHPTCVPAAAGEAGGGRRSGLRGDDRDGNRDEPQGRAGQVRTPLPSPRETRSELAVA